MAKEKKGCLASFFWKVFLPLVVIAIVLIAVLLILSIGPAVTYPAPTFDKRDTGVMAGVVTRLARSLVNKEGRVVETAELHLTQNEVQILLNAMMRDDREDAPETVPYTVMWEDGKVRVYFSASLKSDKAANLFVELAPHVDEGQLTIVPGSGSVGRLPLPRFALDKAARFLEKEAMSREKVRTAISPFSCIEPGANGSLVLMFDPRDVNAVVRVLRSAGGEDAEDEDDEEDEEDEYEDDDSEDIDAGDDSDEE